MASRRNSLGFFLDPITLIGTVISVILAVLFYIRADAATGLGVVAGIVGIVVTLQIQSMAAARRELALEARSQRTLEAIAGIPWLPDIMDKILLSATQVEKRYGDTPAAEAFRSSFEACLSLLTDLERGHFTTQYGDLSMTYSLTIGCKSTLWATSVQDIDFEWWISPRSQRYWTLQQDALQRGVQIIRIFIYHEMNEQLRKLAAVQTAAGLEILFVHRDQLPPQLRTDMVIWDKSCAYETRSNASGDPVMNSYTVAPQDVETMLNQFQVIRTNSHPLHNTRKTGS